MGVCGAICRWLRRRRRRRQCIRRRWQRVWWRWAAGRRRRIQRRLLRSGTCLLRPQVACPSHREPQPSVARAALVPVHRAPIKDPQFSIKHIHKRRRGGVLAAARAQPAQTVTSQHRPTGGHRFTPVCPSHGSWVSLARVCSVGWHGGTHRLYWVGVSCGTGGCSRCCGCGRGAYSAVRADGGSCVKRGVCAGGRIHLPPKALSGDGARVCPPSTLASADVSTLAEPPPSTRVHGAVWRWSQYSTMEGRDLMCTVRGGGGAAERLHASCRHLDAVEIGKT
jgi:hypothetical protein